MNVLIETLQELCKKHRTRVIDIQTHQNENFMVTFDDGQPPICLHCPDSNDSPDQYAKTARGFFKIKPHSENSAVE